MVGSSKILTVSYGTFSCTLEGFEDPFSTMKSIAEYFRDLAADDRYFGAEPPTPDVEMLQKIAEREVKRRVEARLSTEGVVLRHPEPVASPPPAVRSREPEAEAPADTGVADRLSRIRAVVERARSVAAAPVAPPGGYDDLVEDEPDAVASDAGTAPSPTAWTEDEVSAPGPGAPAAGVEDHDAPAEAPVAAAGSVFEGDTEEDSLAAGPSDAEAETVADVERTDVAHEAPEEDEPFAAVAEAPDEAASVALAAEEEEYEDEGDLVADDDFEGADRGWAETDSVSMSDDAEDAAEGDGERHDDEAAKGAAEDQDDEDDDMGGLAARIVKLKRADLEQGLLSDDDEENAGYEDPRLAAGIRMALDAEARALAQERKEQRMERRSALISRPEREPTFDRILEETNTKMADSEGTRRRSAIAHLKAAVAATKADRLLKRQRTAEEEDAEEQSAYREDLAKVVRPRRSEPAEGFSRRPSEMSQAAAPLVLVSSQRVDAPEAEAPEYTRPSSEPVRPRRVGAGMLALDADAPEDDEEDTDEGFAAFAAEVGARDLADLLEAAAAYLAFVEGYESFSRPQIMRRAASVETDEDFTREAGLRSFGQLLRQGKIRKLQRGQFMIAENTRFHPERRFAGEQLGGNAKS